MRLTCHPKLRSHQIIRLWLRMTILIFITSCATFPGKQASKTPTTKPGGITTVQPPGEPPRETMKPETTNYAMIQSPKRQVSTQLAAQGKAFLDKKDYDHARQRLEEAVSVDPTNGAAYYQLAVVYYDLRDTSKALGFLDQAETLLHGSPEWAETIQKFRTIISGSGI